MSVHRGTIRAKVVAIFRRGSAVLVNEFEDPWTGASHLGVPGGGIEFGERSIDALHRELHEELGIDLAGATLLGVLENHFEWMGQPAHEIVFVYEARAADPGFYERDEVWREEDQPDHRGETRFVNRWVPLEDMEKALVPGGLRELLLKTLNP